MTRLQALRMRAGIPQPLTGEPPAQTGGAEALRRAMSNASSGAPSDGPPPSREYVSTDDGVKRGLLAVGVMGVLAVGLLSVLGRPRRAAQVRSGA